MKTLILTMLLLIGMISTAQDCGDIVYPTDGSAVIFDCCIKEVKDGNMVMYTKGTESHMIRAKTIVRGGLTLQLTKINPTIGTGIYRGHDYDYYKSLSEKARRQRNVGSFLTITGFGFQVIGIVFLADGNYSNDGAGQAFYWLGFIEWSVGLPLWISGGVKNVNNKRAMEECRRNTANIPKLNLGLTSNGVGLTLKF